jgi:hypothetical protein
MRSMAILGLALIDLGIAGLIFSHVSGTETKPVVKAGPFEINTQQDHTVWIPQAGGVLAGLGLVVASKRAGDRRIALSFAA